VRRARRDRYAVIRRRRPPLQPLDRQRRVGQLVPHRHIDHRARAHADQRSGHARRSPFFREGCDVHGRQVIRFRYQRAIRTTSRSVSVSPRRSPAATRLSLASTRSVPSGSARGPAGPRARAGREDGREDAERTQGRRHRRRFLWLLATSSG
jgi:hypothetical protein